MEFQGDRLLPQALLVDLPEIDNQHEEIFNRIESLKAACFENNFAPLDELRELIDYCAEHFATEERIAEEVGLEFEDHAKIHRDTLRLLQRALSEVGSGGHNAHSFLRYAEYWFERHINEDDRVFSIIVPTGKQTSCHRPATAATRFSAPI